MSMMKFSDRKIILIYEERMHFSAYGHLKSHNRNSKIKDICPDQINLMYLIKYN